MSRHPDAFPDQDDPLWQTKIVGRKLGVQRDNCELTESAGQSCFSSSGIAGEPAYRAGVGYDLPTDSAQ